MKRIFSKCTFVSAVLLAALSSTSWASTPEDCQRAIDEISVKGRANYDSATEAEMTKHLSAANTSLMQKNGSTQALKELKAYEQSLNGAMNAQKIPQGDGAVLKDKLDKAMKCVSGLK
ncbi:MAG: hypothetical protein WAS49_04720 [Candidatus Dechloromonas phosphoritropha]|jgi:hypothetical protein|nr:hypothetical protein [Candidatus Dechloromonas phosphoritropha]MBP8786932.1 hypothetical protein [Azonexus sp.]MBP9227431.1 hypothetical protein [Azonexus sp.]